MATTARTYRVGWSAVIRHYLALIDRLPSSIGDDVRYQLLRAMLEDAIDNVKPTDKSAQ